jgi:hypothetical protein
MVFLATCFLTFADVVTDTLCVERSNFEESHVKGSLQATGFVYKSTGKILGAVLGTYLYDNGTRWSFEISDMFILESAVPAVLLSVSFWPLLEFASKRGLPRFDEQLSEVWRTLQLRAVWRPMIFIYMFDVMQVPNSAWTNFLVWGLNFNDRQLGYLTMTSALVSWLGYIADRAGPAVQSALRDPRRRLCRRGRPRRRLL